MAQIIDEAFARNLLSRLHAAVNAHDAAAVHGATKQARQFESRYDGRASSLVSRCRPAINSTAFLKQMPDDELLLHAVQLHQKVVPV